MLGKLAVTEKRNNLVRTKLAITSAQCYYSLKKDHELT
jgi:hypothetical protein